MAAFDPAKLAASKDKTASDIYDEAMGKYKDPVDDKSETERFPPMPGSNIPDPKPFTLGPLRSGRSND